MSGDRYFVSDQNAIFFITCTVVGWLDVFTRKAYRLELVDSLNYCIEEKGLVVYAWCIMSNHVHLIVRAKEGYRLSDIIRDFKKFTAKQIIKKIETESESRRNWMLNQFKYAGRNLKRIKNYKFWKDDNHAIELASHMMESRLNYIHQNPVVAMIVEEPEHYIFSSAKDYCGLKGLVGVELIS